MQHFHHLVPRKENFMSFFLKKDVSSTTNQKMWCYLIFYHTTSRFSLALEKVTMEMMTSWFFFSARHFFIFVTDTFLITLFGADWAFSSSNTHYVFPLNLYFSPPDQCSCNSQNPSICNLSSGLFLCLSWQCIVADRCIDSIMHLGMCPQR